MHAAIVDVRAQMPRGPAAGKSKSKGKGKKRDIVPVVDSVIGQDGFVDAAVLVVQVCMKYGRAIVGSHKCGTPA